jgi:hypothetical protein
LLFPLNPQLCRFRSFFFSTIALKEKSSPASIINRPDLTTTVSEQFSAKEMNLWEHRLWIGSRRRPRQAATSRCPTSSTGSSNPRRSLRHPRGGRALLPSRPSTRPGLRPHPASTRPRLRAPQASIRPRPTASILRASTTRRPSRPRRLRADTGPRRSIRLNNIPLSSINPSNTPRSLARTPRKRSTRERSPSIPSNIRPTSTAPPRNLVIRTSTPPGGRPIRRRMEPLRASLFPS